MTPLWLRFAAAVALLLALATVRASNAADPIRIGYLGPLTGIFAQAGKDMLDGLKLSLEQVNHEVAGRKIELVIEDSQGKPDIGLTKARKLVESDRVHLLLAELVSVVGNAMAPYVNAERIPWVNTVALAALTRSQRSPYIFRFVPSSYQFGLTGDRKSVV